MSRVQPVFVHGWGFGPAFWTPLVTALGWTDACVLDLGFLGAESGTPAQAAQQLQALQGAGQAVLGVGHSLGFMWLAGQMGLSATDRLVGINAFAAFAARTDFASGVPVRVLQRMLKGVSSTPEKVLADFRAVCGAPAVDGPLSPQNLRYGLDLLISGDVRPVMARKRAQCSVLAARQDPLVPPAMTEDSFAEGVAVQWTDGGHLLPQTNVGDCVAFLQAARRKMEQGAG